MHRTMTLREQPYLFAQAWQPPAPKGVVCLVHGLGEHSGRYGWLAEALNAAGFALLAMDLPGHGRSEGKRGHWSGYEDTLDAMGLLLQRAETEFPDLPRFLYGHSLGGNLVLNYALRRDTSPLRGVVASSPWLRLTMKPPAYKIWLARTAGRLLPSFVQPNGLRAEDLSHDPAVVQGYEADPLVHHNISAALFLQTHEAGQWAMAHAGELSVPLLLMHGTADPITDPEASREFCERAGEWCTLRLWPDMYHEVHNEIGREEVYQALIAWLEARLQEAS